MMGKFTIDSFKESKIKGCKISMLTAYDYCFANIVDEAGIDAILIGDSLGMVIQGNDSTLPVTVDEIIYHTKIVKKAVKRAFVIADMPFMSYHVSKEDAVRNAGRIVKESGAEAVKLEGGIEFIDMVKSIVNANIPVVGHIGMTPQSINAFGGFKVQGRNLQQAQKIFDDAKLLEAAGVFAITLECVPESLAKLITKTVKIPTIGIGAGKYCDGQVLVLNDMLGLYKGFSTTFLKQYANLANSADEAIKKYIKEVNNGNFPGFEHSYKYSNDEEIINNIKK